MARLRTCVSERRVSKVSLRIVVADAEPDTRGYLRRLLPRLGHQVVEEAGTGPELIDISRATQPPFRFKAASGSEASRV